MQVSTSIEFEVPFQGQCLRGDRWVLPGAVRTALLLHGGGSSAADGFQALRRYLHDRETATVAFDFVGHGRTGGSQLGTTLQQRVQQVLAVVNSQRLEPEALVLIGFSMGAYVAAKAAVQIGARGLCLAIPAAYDAQAYGAPFGPEFTRILRSPGSWARSDAFGLVGRYAGHLLVLSAEDDQVVPAEIPLMYAAHAKHCASSSHYVVTGSRHNLSEHYEKRPAARDAAYAEIASLCQRVGAETRAGCDGALQKEA
ncbi:MAG TPA: alpha/beta fold hydrolase [Rubrivivax sp.]|nr:alpha/beta fold hydrolase [Rubrivivax sp.]